MPAKGQTVSEETCERMRVAARKRAADPEWKRKHDEAARRLSKDPEWRAKQKEASCNPDRCKKISGKLKGRKFSDTHIQNIRKSAIKRFSDPEQRRLHDETARRLALDPEWRLKQKSGCQNRNDVWCNNISAAAKKRYEDPKQKMRHDEIARTLALDPEWHNKLSRSQKKKFEEDEIYRLKHDETARRLALDPEWRSKQRDGVIKSYAENPNRRKKLSDAANKRFSDPEQLERHQAAMEQRNNSREWQTKVCGSNSPLWKGGISFLPYCFKFNKRRRKSVRTFFNNQCICCGINNNDVRGNLSVHHIDHDKEQGCNGKPFNLVPLCPSCHSKELHRQEEYREYINKTLEKGFKWGIWSRAQYKSEVMYPE